MTIGEHYPFRNAKNNEFLLVSKRTSTWTRLLLLLPWGRDSARVGQDC